MSNYEYELDNIFNRIIFSLLLDFGIFFITIFDHHKLICFLKLLIRLLVSPSLLQEWLSTNILHTYSDYDFSYQCLTTHYLLDWSYISVK